MRTHYGMTLVQPGMHWVWASTAIYIAACFLPAFRDSAMTMMGWHCLIFGCLLLRIETMIWWASNPIYFVAILLYWRKWLKTSAILGSLAVLSALSFELMFWWEGSKVLIGCVLWVASLQIFAINAVWALWVDHRKRLGCLLPADLVPEEKASPDGPFVPSREES